VRPIAVLLPELHAFISTYGSSSIADKHMAVKEEKEEEQEYRKSSTMDEDCEEDDNFTASDDDLSVDGTAVGKRSRLVTKKDTRATKRPHSSAAGSR